jgi:PhnB protein
MQIQPYLFLDGRCEEAIRFYETALGAKVELLMRVKEAPETHPAMPAGSENKILHVTLRIGEAVLLMSDGMCGGRPEFKGFSLSLQAPPAEVDRLFARLVDGGEVSMPLGKTFWSPRFGMLVDRFGVHWMIGVAA